jgi:hypothetical protein
MAAAGEPRAHASQPTFHLLNGRGSLAARHLLPTVSMTMRNLYRGLLLSCLIGSSIWALMRQPEVDSVAAGLLRAVEPKAEAVDPRIGRQGDLPTSVRPAGERRDSGSGDQHLGEHAEVSTDPSDGKDTDQHVALTKVPPSAAELREFRAYVSSTILEMREEKATIQLANVERQQVDLEQWMPELATWLELSATQSGRMKSALIAQLDLSAEYWRKWQHGADQGLLDEQKEADSIAHSLELKSFLDESQYLKYSEETQ